MLKISHSKQEIEWNKQLKLFHLFIFNSILFHQCVNNELYIINMNSMAIQIIKWIIFFHKNSHWYKRTSWVLKIYENWIGMLLKIYNS